MTFTPRHNLHATWIAGVRQSVLVWMPFDICDWVSCGYRVDMFSSVNMNLQLLA
jgi:hypothetical protein